ncbi:hypothetical protein LJC23_04225 [Desulfovibrio sp. OttesenSCG-928-I05]|nr:hypothetical protein [Desulfovibrio sp. OttesenSCG-928-I05]
MSRTETANAVHCFLDWLDERCLFLRHLEKEAAEVARTESASPRYRHLMLQKALFLEAMGEEAEPFMNNIPVPMAETARARFQRYAASAQQAMDLDSPFYMSALLYPEDHRPGEPNDLESLHAQLADMAKKEGV